MAHHQTRDSFCKRIGHGGDDQDDQLWLIVVVAVIGGVGGMLRLGDESNKASVAGVEIRICISLEQGRNRVRFRAGLCSLAIWLT